MKAVRMERTGGPEVLELVEVPTPVPGPSQALVKAHTIGVNMPEVLVRKGRYGWMPPLPTIPGIEMSGTIAALGSEVNDFSLGQAVYVSARELPHRCGCYAEYIAVDTHALVEVPPKVDLEAAATLASYQVAWHLLYSATRGFEYDSVLVTAAAGGIGSAAVQLAAAAEFKVIALASSPEKAAFAKRLGASVAVAQTEEGWTDRIREATENRGADLILDAIGGARFPLLFDHLARLGLVIQYGQLAGLPESAAVYDAMRTRMGHSPALRLFSMHTFDDNPARRRACTETLLGLLARGAIGPVIQQRLPLAEAARAHELLEGGKVLGKLVLKP
ncbi:MAG: zinc-binding dehydrogenase [Betaproteobacteria bacterium]|nr:zinc-binding dehydrogenase [Betaproteobacteria bacterium]